MLVSLSAGQYTCRVCFPLHVSVHLTLSSGALHLIWPDRVWCSQNIAHMRLMAQSAITGCHECSVSQTWCEEDSNVVTRSKVTFYWFSSTVIACYCICKSWAKSSYPVAGRLQNNTCSIKHYLATDSICICIIAANVKRVGLGSVGVNSYRYLKSLPVSLCCQTWNIDRNQYWNRDKWSPSQYSYSTPVLISRNLCIFCWKQSGKI